MLTSLAALEWRTRVVHGVGGLDLVEFANCIVSGGVEKALVHLRGLVVVQISAVGGHVDLVCVSFVSL